MFHRSVHEVITSQFRLWEPAHLKGSGVLGQARAPRPHPVEFPWEFPLGAAGTHLLLAASSGERPGAAAFPFLP